jgi:hypothetical protein
MMAGSVAPDRAVEQPQPSSQVASVASFLWFIPDSNLNIKPWARKYDTVACEGDALTLLILWI